MKAIKDTKMIKGFAGVWLLVAMLMASSGILMTELHRHQYGYPILNLSIGIGIGAITFQIALELIDSRQWIGALMWRLRCRLGLHDEQERYLRTIKGDNPRSELLAECRRCGDQILYLAARDEKDRITSRRIRV